MTKSSKDSCATITPPDKTAIKLPGQPCRRKGKRLSDPKKANQFRRRYMLLGQPLYVGAKGQMGVNAAYALRLEHRLKQGLKQGLDGPWAIHYILRSDIEHSTSRSGSRRRGRRRRWRLSKVS